MTIKIAFDVKLGGKHVGGGIEWEGTREQILAMMRDVEARAARNGVTPEHLVQSVYAHLPTMGLREKRNERELQSSLMVYGVVRLTDEYATESEMPTYSLVDLVEEQDIFAKVAVRGSETHHKISMEINGAPQ
jgi:hypothetical protein